MGSVKSHYIVKNPKTGELETICLETGEVISKEHADLSRYKFNSELATLVCQKVREGGTFKKVCADLNIDLAVLHYWQRAYPHFANEIRLARLDRADYYHDKVLEEAENVQTKDDVIVAKFKVDQYKWAAEKGNPDAYGAKTQVSGSIENKVSMIVLNTGIKRIKPDIEVQYEHKEDQSNIGQQTSGTDGAGVQRPDQTGSPEETIEEPKE